MKTTTQAQVSVFVLHLFLAALVNFLPSADGFFLQQYQLKRINIAESGALSYSAGSTNDNTSNNNSANTTATDITKPFSYIETLKDSKSETTKMPSAVWSDEEDSSMVEQQQEDVVKSSSAEFRPTLTDSSIDQWYNLLTAIEEHRLSPLPSDGGENTSPAGVADNPPKQSSGEEPDEEKPEKKSTDHWMF